MQKKIDKQLGHLKAITMISGAVWVVTSALAIAFLIMVENLWGILEGFTISWVGGFFLNLTICFGYQRWNKPMVLEYLAYPVLIHSVAGISWAVVMEFERLPTLAGWVLIFFAGLWMGHFFVKKKLLAADSKAQQKYNSVKRSG